MEGAPVEAVVVEEQDPGELAGGVEVGPVDPGSAAAAAAAVGDEGAEGRVEGGQEREIRRVLGVLVPRVDRGSGLLPPPLLVLHLLRLERFTSGFKSPSPTHILVSYFAIEANENSLERLSVIPFHRSGRVGSARPRYGM